MATHHGKEGTVKIGANALAEVTEWSLEEAVEVADDTAMGDASKTHLAGQKSWNGSVTCHWDETNTTGQGALTIGASVQLNLYPEGATTGDVYHSGTATVTGISHNASMTSIVDVTFTFQGNGDLTHPTVV